MEMNDKSVEKKSFQEIGKNVMSKKSELQIFFINWTWMLVFLHIFTVDKLM